MNEADSALRIVLKPAQPDDAAAIAALLAAADLPHTDIAPHLGNFLVAWTGETAVGAVGLEVHGSDALLRSLVVAPELRGRGLGDNLAETIVARARGLGVTRLFLLTTTAERFFARRGFAVVARRIVPAAIAATAEFRGLCPATAVCMARALTP
ncbi:MAG: GNAT family N-acetyltransferase [Opitutae bacterium]|nr:GNAT family N-acetyltransferase [Opitutae bacterium]